MLSVATNTPGDCVQKCSSRTSSTPSNVEAWRCAQARAASSGQRPHAARLRALPQAPHLPQAAVDARSDSVPRRPRLQQHHGCGLDHGQAAAAAVAAAVVRECGGGGSPEAERKANWTAAGQASLSHLCKIKLAITMDASGSQKPQPRHRTSSPAAMMPTLLTVSANKCSSTEDRLLCRPVGAMSGHASTHAAAASHTRVRTPT